MPRRHRALAPRARPCAAAGLATNLRGGSRRQPRRAEMSCLSFESLSAELDGELAELEREAVRSHLDGCDKCRARRTELLLLRSAVRDAFAAPLDFDGLKARLKATVRKRRRASAFRVALGIAAAAAVVVLLVPVVGGKDVVTELVGDHLGTTVTGEEPFDVVSSDPNVVE